MITAFYVRAEVDNETTVSIYPDGVVEGLKALSVVDLAVLSVLLKETAESVDRALDAAKNERAGAEAEQRLREKGILR